MIPERWQLIARIYDSVIDREPTEHGVLLDEACGTDQGLRREVESLLSQESVQGPLDSDVMEVAAELLEDPSELAAGMRLGPYRIDAIIGAGGMGQVYAATDTRLGRRVAIKILPAAIANNTSVRLRFEREARTIASLTHPHICTLYDVGREKPATDGGQAFPTGSEQAVDFLVMEFLEGETLAARLGRAAEPEGPPIQVEEALRVAIEIADALAAAHRHGIVHRDLKPGNIMLARRGGPSGPPAAKLLDFGLATTAPPIVPGATGSMLSTSPASLTGHGAIVGTIPAYCGIGARV
jgi:serine/threonine protein kinase